MRRFTIVVTLLAIIFVMGIGTIPSAKAAESRQTGVTCVSYQSPNDSAFPFTAFYTHPPQGYGPVCGGKFLWGYTDNPKTADAVWSGMGLAGYDCIFNVYIPDTYATAQSAQYFIFDGTRYLANVVINQNAYTNEYAYLGNWHISTRAIIQMSDKQGNGVRGEQIAATAISYNCFA